MTNLILVEKARSLKECVKTEVQNDAMRLLGLAFPLDSWCCRNEAVRLRPQRATGCAALTTVRVTDWEKWGEWLRPPSAQSVQAIADRAPNMTEADFIWSKKFQCRYLTDDHDTDAQWSDTIRVTAGN